MDNNAPYGNDLAGTNRYAVTPSACAQLCNNLPGCAGFTYTLANMWCYPKSSMDTSRTDFGAHPCLVAAGCWGYTFGAALTPGPSTPTPSGSGSSACATASCDGCASCSAARTCAATYFCTGGRGVSDFTCSTFNGVGVWSATCTTSMSSSAAALAAPAACALAAALAVQL